MPQRCFYRFFVDFSFSRSFEPEAESCMWPLAHEWHKPSPTEGKPGRMPIPSRLKVFSRSDMDIHPLYGLPFHVFRQVPFSSHTDFRRFFSNLPPPLFTSIFMSFSEPHQSVISVLGAKVIPGLDGNARSSLLFSAKISSPSGSIFPEKPCIS